MLADAMPFARNDQEAQAILLKEERALSKDANSDAVKSAIEYRQDLAAADSLNESDPLRPFIEVDQFGSAVSREGSNGLLSRSDGLIDKAGQLTRRGLSIEEEEMSALASNYSEFSMGTFRDSMLERSQMFMASSQGRAADDVSAVYSAQSSSEIKNAAEH